MKLQLKIALASGALALSATPALAHGKPVGTPPHGHAYGQQGSGPDYTPAPHQPGPKSGLPEQAKAYGRYCNDQSRKHVKGEQGTPFSQCVKAMAKAANNKNLSPGQACKGMSKAHKKGEKGTAFSRCVKAAAKLRGEQSSS